jgi:glycosyltransferase involved in cell wall biosynthesis
MVTARDDYAILGCPNLHIFEPLINSLNNQKFKNFELIIVDSLYEYRDTSPFDEATFDINHVPPKDCVWVDLCMFHSANNFNTGLIHAEGELIVKIDDCMSIYNNNHLDLLWNWYNKGFMPLQTYMYYFKGRPAIYSESLTNEIFKLGNFTEFGKNLLLENWSDEIYKKGDQIQDTRISQFDTQTKISTHEWYYGVSSVPLRDALAVNGYDENHCGCRGLEDIDFGLRLEMYGTIPFILDKDLLLVEHINNDLSKKAVNKRIFFRNEYVLYYLNKINKRIQANKHIFTGEEIEFIREQTINPTINEYVRPSTQKAEYDPYWFDFWAKNLRTFDLKNIRYEETMGRDSF